MATRQTKDQRIAELEAANKTLVIGRKQDMTLINALRDKLARIGHKPAGTKVLVRREGDQFQCWNGEKRAGEYPDFMSAHSKARELRTAQ